MKVVLAGAYGKLGSEILLALLKNGRPKIGLTGDWRKCGPVFALPWRTMMGVENDNLAAAGRCISVTNDMWDITRVIPTAALTGEITGLAAAMAGRRGLRLPELNVTLLQDALRSKGNIVEKP